MNNRKMRWIIPALCGVMLLAACGKTDEPTSEGIGSVTYDQTADTSSIVSESIVGSADQKTDESITGETVSTEETGSSTETESAADKIMPLPETIDIDNLTDCQVAASFKPGDITKNDDGSLSVRFEVYDYELFDAVDISKMKVGDTIEILKKDIEIKSKEENDYGLIAINGGFEEGGYDLYPEGGGTYCTTTVDDSRDYYSLGTATMKTTKDFRFVDQSEDPQAAGKEYDADDFLNKFTSDNTEYDPYYTRVLISTDGEIKEINRIFVP